MRVSLQSHPLSAVAVFCGSFLLFMVQPMVGRSLLPVFGGSASVWCVCLACYQTLLLVGYGYAHGLTSSGRSRWPHVAVLAVAALCAFAMAAQRPAFLAWLGVGVSGVWTVLFGVVLLVGVPYVALAAGSTLVQAWLSETSAGQAHGGSDVYRLYAVSNVGSLLGLLSYPLAIEPFVPLTAQWWGWAAGFAAYVVLMAVLSLRVRRNQGATLERSSDASIAPGSDHPSPLWFFLPAVTAFLLNATTAHLMVDVTPLPLFWAVLLAAFLLSYVMGFSSWGGLRRGLWCFCAGASLAAAAAVRGKWGTGSFFPNAWAGLSVIFFVGTVIHAWLYEMRPSASGLTRYYLLGAAGGAAGGLLSALVAPLVFTRISEYPLSLFVCAVLVAWRAPWPTAWRAGGGYRWTASALCGVAWLVLLLAMAHPSQANTLFRGRNFYGCLAVTRTFERLGQNRAVFPVHYLFCGQTTHGIQIHAPSPAVRNLGTAYYGQLGGGIAFAAHPKFQADQPMKVGVVGLGAGTLACYGRPGDLFRFYEINPLVVKIATDPQFFTFLPDAKMPIDLVLGDARKMLEKERAAHDPLYDLLVVDAYSGDAVPYHLCTREAFRLYFDRLTEDGLLAVHVSNWHIDLLPLCKAMAKELNVCAYGTISAAQDDVLIGGSVWVFMTRRPMTYRYPGKEKIREVVWTDVRDLPALTDACGSLLPLVRY